MASHLNMRAVQQSLRARGIRFERARPFSDGRNRYAVWPEGKPRLFATHTDDIEHGYITGLRMATARDNARQAQGKVAYA